MSSLLAALQLPPLPKPFRPVRPRPSRKPAAVVEQPGMELVEDKGARWVDREVDEQEIAAFMAGSSGRLDKPVKSTRPGPAKVLPAPPDAETPRPVGTPVHAPAAGVVTFAEPDLVLTGGTVLIDHGFGLSSSFLHMSRLDVKAGDRVERGKVIGAAGMTGRASGPHVHWGFNWFDVRLDPALLPKPAR